MSGRTDGRWSRWLIGALAGAVAAGLVPSGGAAADDQGDTGGQDSSAEQQLVDRFAPIVYLKAQEQSCDADGEPYAPSAVDIVLDNPDVVLRQLGSGNPVVTVAPGAADLHDRGEGFFLDFPGSALDPGCLYERDFDRYTGTVTGERTPTVYGRVATQTDEPDHLVVQYWFYWYYNDWNNKHESDWEGIQLLFDVGTVDEALATDPVSVGYAQHEGGERADWDADKLTREGDRPVVYPSAGSHASYFGSALYLGRSASEGFGCDTTDGPSDRTDPDVVLLPETVSGPDDPFAWLTFDGRWGERQSGPFNGPTGPHDKERWTDPVDWHDELRAASVVVPAGDGPGESVINAFCDVVEAGSGSLITLKTSPLRLAVTVFAAVAALAWLGRRTVWNLVPAFPLVARRRAGQIVRAAASSYRHRARVLITIGLVYLPTAALVALVARGLEFVPLISRLTAVSGNAAETSLIFAAFAGSVANLLAYVAVNAMVASYFDLLGGGDGRSDVDGDGDGDGDDGGDGDGDGDGEASGPDAVRRAWSHAPELLVGFSWSTVIVVALLISVIGIPIALWLLVRWQFMPQVVVTEHLDGRAALARSARLVRGRWWHTALMILSINLLVVLAGGLTGLLLLVVFAGIPLWLFSAVVTLVYALIAPLAAVAQTLLFGDAVAEAEQAEHPPAGRDDGATAPAVVGRG